MFLLSAFSLSQKPGFFLTTLNYLIYYTPINSLLALRKRIYKNPCLKNTSDCHIILIFSVKFLGKSFTRTIFSSFDFLLICVIALVWSCACTASTLSSRISPIHFMLLKNNGYWSIFALSPWFCSIFLYKYSLFKIYFIVLNSLFVSLFSSSLIDYLFFVSVLGEESLCLLEC